MRRRVLSHPRAPLVPLLVVLLSASSVVRSMLPSARKKHNSTLRMAQKEGAKRAHQQWQPWWQLLELVAADRRGQQIPRRKPGLETVSDHNEVTQKGDANAARLRAVQRLSCVPLLLTGPSSPSPSPVPATTPWLPSPVPATTPRLSSLPLPVVRTTACVASSSTRVCRSRMCV